jgi:hypothetical protein
MPPFLILEQRQNCARSVKYGFRPFGATRPVLSRWSLEGLRVYLWIEGMRLI